MNNKGHVWLTIGDSEFADPDDGSEFNDQIDIFAYTYGEFHNGPKCKNCGYGFCHHCLNDPPFPCTEVEKSHD